MITTEEVERVAHLAKLRLNGDALERMSRDLSDILGYIDQLGEVDAGDASDVAERAMEPRSDTARSSGIGIAEIEANAPDFRNGFFVVPPVIG